MIYHSLISLTNRMTLLVAEIAELIGAWKAVNHNTLLAVLRQLHLMDSKTIGTTPYSVKGEGDFSVDKPDYRDGKIYINATQYFDNAPAVAWTFYIGGYQPAQKWLKDRKGRTLTLDDVKHYQKILKILVETDSVMREMVLDPQTGATSCSH